MRSPSVRRPRFELLSPLAVVLERPLLIHPAARDAVERVPGLGVDEREVEVAEEEEEGDVHQPVMDEDGVGEAKARVAFAVPEERTRDREQNRERGRGDRVQLLAGVEPTLRRMPPLEPLAIVAVPEIDFADRVTQAPAVPDGDDQEQ